MKRALFALSALLGALSGCARAHPPAAVTFVEPSGATLACPVRSALSTEESALAVSPPRSSPTTPWVEPEPFPGVVSDPQRLRLWRATVRDPAYLEWQQANARPDAETQELAASYGERRVFAVRGCGQTALYACWNHTCSGLDETASVVCRNGGSLRMTGSGETMRFECGAPVASAPIPPPADAKIEAVSYSQGVVARDRADVHLKEQLAKVEADLALAAQKRER